jgi:small neutral amino acid transporter SnatA (MarC family)
MASVCTRFLGHHGVLVVATIMTVVVMMLVVGMLLDVAV